MIRILAKQNINQAKYIKTLQQKIIQRIKPGDYKNDYECLSHLLNKFIYILIQKLVKK